MTNAQEEFYGRPNRQRPFSGQLQPSFQERLQAAYGNVTSADCHFYHTLDLGNGQVVPGGWDMRGSEHSYLGHVRFDGFKVLEFGPASGYLTFWMEEQGADVTVFDLPPGHPPDLLPLPGIDLEANAASGAETARQVRNSWWYAHKKRQSRAKAVYGDIYNLPPDLGRHDISTWGSILLHLGNPFGALREAARITDKALIVTELLPPIVYGNEHNSFMEFNPGNEPDNLVNWWSYSPGAIKKMLKMLGFPHIDTHYFQIHFHPGHKTDAQPLKRFMVTAVGQREAATIPRFEKTPEESETDRALRNQIPVIGIDGFNEAHRGWQDVETRLQDAEIRFADRDARLRKTYESLAWKLTKPIRFFMGE